MRVEEVINNDHCGFGAVVNDEVILEYAWGFYASIDRLGVQVGRFRVDEHGVVREHEAPIQFQAYQFDPAVGALALRDSSPSRLPDVYLSVVAEGIRTLGTKFPGARFEWIGVGTRPFLVDASFESGQLPKWGGDSRPLSQGTASAEVYKIQDLIHLESIWPDHVSVWRNPEFFALVRRTSKAELLPAAPAGDKYIIAAPYPAAILALLLDHAAGFVFERGSSLCHLAIILRHHGIPAYVVGDRYKALAARTRLRLPDDVA